MWSKTYEVVAEGVSANQIWQIWSDMNSRTLWDKDTEWVEMNEPFQAGSKFKFKPVGGPKMTMQITECTPGRSFTDCFNLIVAKLYGIHLVTNVAEGVKITTIVQVTGLLGWILRKLVAEDIIATVPEQTAAVVELAKKVPK